MSLQLATPLPHRNPIQRGARRVTDRESQTERSSESHRLRVTDREELGEVFRPLSGSICHESITVLCGVFSSRAKWPPATEGQMKCK